MINELSSWIDNHRSDLSPTNYHHPSPTIINQMSLYYSTYYLVWVLTLWYINVSMLVFNLPLDTNHHPRNISLIWQYCSMFWLSNLWPPSFQVFKLCSIDFYDFFRFLYQFSLISNKIKNFNMGFSIYLIVAHGFPYINFIS